MDKQEKDNSLNFLEKITSYSEQIQTNIKELTKEIDKLSNTIGTELFDPSAAEELLDRVNSIKDEMIGMQSSVKSTFSPTIVNEFLKVLNKSISEAEILSDDLAAKKLFNSAEMFSQQTYSYLNELNAVLDSVKSLLGTEKFDISPLNELLENIYKLKEEMQSFISSTDFGYNDIIKNDILEIIDALSAATTNISNIAKSMSAIHGNILEIKAPFEEIFDSFTSFTENIPIFGNALKKFSNIDTIKDELNKKLTSIFSNISETGKISAKDISNAYLETFKSMGNVLMGIFKAVLLNPWMLAAIGIALLVKKFVDLQNEAEEFRKTNSLSYDASKKLTHEIEETALSARIYGVTLEDAFETASKLIGVFGSSKLITGKLATDLSILSKTTGISGENAANVYRNLSATASASSESALNMSNTLTYVSQLMGIPMDSMFSNIAESGEFISTYLRKSNLEIVKAAANARMWGLEMKDVESITNSIMDFESSIEKELMASILVGRQIDFNRARYLAFHGQIAEATNEVMKQIGTLEDFNKLDPVAAKALAEAAGLTVEQLRNSLQTQQLINSAVGKEKEDLIKAKNIIEGKLDLSAEEQKEMQKAAIMNQSALTQMKNLWNQIGASLTKAVLPAIEAMGAALKFISDALIGLYNLIDSSSDATDSFGNKLGKALASVLAILLGFVAIKYLLLGMGKLISMLPGLGGGGAGGAGGGGRGILGSIFGNVNPTQILAASASILIISAAIWVFAKSLQEIDKVKDINTALVAVSLGLLLMVAAAYALSSVGPVVLIGAASIAVLAGAIWLLGKAINEFVPFIDTLLKGLSIIVKSIGEAVSSVISSVANAIVNISNVDAMNLYAVAGAIGVLSLALASFGGGSVFAGIGSFIGNFLGGDPIEKLKELATLGPGLISAAMGIRAINDAMLGKEINVSNINTPQTTTLPVNASLSLNEIVANGNNLIIEKLNKLIEISNNKLDIYIDGKKVTTAISKSASINKLT